MTKADKDIKTLGYEEKEVNISCNFIVYENNRTDTRVEIEWDDDDEFCKVFPMSLSMQKDWQGRLRHQVGCLTITEMSAFTAKIQEMRD